MQRSEHNSKIALLIPGVRHGIDTWLGSWRSDAIRSAAPVKAQTCSLPIVGEIRGL